MDEPLSAKGPESTGCEGTGSAGWEETESDVREMTKGRPVLGSTEDGRKSIKGLPAVQGRAPGIVEAGASLVTVVLAKVTGGG